MIKVIIFDWSGVIKNSIGSHLWVVNAIFKKFGVKEISLKDLKEGWKEPYMLFYNKYLPNLTITEEQSAYLEAVLNKDCPKSNAYQGIPELIKKIKEKGISVAVVSSDMPKTLLPEIKEYGLENIFDDVLTNIYGKVNTLQVLIKKYNVNPKEIFFIGDSNHEIEAGKKVGIKTIAVTWGFCSEKTLKLENPDFIAHNLEELEKIIL